MKFSEVVDTSERVAATRSRTAKVGAVAEALRAAGPGEARLVAHYLSGSLPQRRTGIGWRSLADLPEPAAEPTLQVTEVDAVMAELAGLAGAGSAARRKEALGALFARATAAEQRLLRGLLTGEVRQGALDGVLQTAIATAADVPVAAVRRAVMLAGSSTAVVEAALSGGEAALAEVGLVVGRPLMPMLAGSAPDVADALAQVADGGSVALERKLDGIRLQAHKFGDEVRLFTRSLDDITDRLPEVVEAVRALPADSVVLDAEAIALRADGRPHPFQVTGARTASRTDPATLAATTPVSTFVFDVLHLDGEDLLDHPARERFDRLASLVDESLLVPRLVTDDVDEAQAFFAAQIEAGHEGVVVKSLDAPYAAGRRGAGWVKVKPRHTLDLVVVAVEWGSGRRAGKLSNIHLAARGEAEDTSVSEARRSDERADTRAARGEAEDTSVSEARRSDERADTRAARGEAEDTSVSEARRSDERADTRAARGEAEDTSVSEARRSDERADVPVARGRGEGAGGFVMLGKTFKGMTDEMLDWQTERFLALETHRKGHVVYVRPEQVVEIAFDGLQKSSRYPGGLALRFARVLRYRDDKTAAGADTIATVRALAGVPPTE